VIPYVNDEQAEAATKNPQLKLIFRLLKFTVLDEGQPELFAYGGNKTDTTAVRC
jgi:replication fork protection complex subunit Tof1/Swi1